MTLNEIKNYDSVKDTEGANCSTVPQNEHPVQNRSLSSQRPVGNKKNLYLVKARMASGSLVLTSPYAKKGGYYAARVDKQGIITYTPLAIDGKKPHGMRVVKAYLTGPSVAMTAYHAVEGEYYHVSVDEQGVITYTPMLLAAKAQESDE